MRVLVGHERKMLTLWEISGDKLELLDEIELEDCRDINYIIKRNDSVPWYLVACEKGIVFITIDLKNNKLK